MKWQSLAGSSLLVAFAGACSAPASKRTVTVTVSPVSTDVLTCSQTSFTATVTGSDDATVTWSLAPPGVGSLDAAGTYTAPLATPAPNGVTVTATSAAEPSAQGSAAVTLATAFPGPARTIDGSTALVGGVFPHSLATSGARIYAVWSTAASASPSLMVARSDDAGATWKPAVGATKVNLANGATEPIDCVALAIDAGDPDVVYAYGSVRDRNDLGDAAAQASGGPTSFLAVSTDGGATFTTSVMQVGGAAGGVDGWDQVGICGDVASPAANAVVVESPGGYNGDGNPDIAIWADGSRGAGFRTGVAQDGDYVAHGVTHALDNLQGDHDIGVAQNGSSDDAGGATESPRLLTDGKGRLCLTYKGLTDGGVAAHVYLQCSDALAKTFSAPLVVDPQSPAGTPLTSPVGAFGPNQSVAELWSTGLTDGQLLVATSSDGGETFGAQTAIPTYLLPDQSRAPATNPSIGYDAAGILWIGYHAYDGALHARLVVDKSCDGGKTWSGAVLVNGPEETIVDGQLPALVMTPGRAPQLAASAGNHRVLFSLTPS
ncbi:MAG: sialidase family protein [Sorangiineae bacterium]|nr:sialidase family protein [Polyangiaceae bacterium]MEB2323120.1 sialidase family protein [Sorangiineae bacterium]